MAGGALLIVGFAQAADYGFGVPGAYAVIIAGVVVMGAAIINFLFTKRNAIVPAVSVLFSSPESPNGIPNSLSTSIRYQSHLRSRIGTLTCT